MKAIATASDLSYRANGEVILRHIDLEICPGDVLHLQGRTGSGRTTLGLLLSDVLPIEMRAAAALLPHWLVGYLGGTTGGILVPCINAIYLFSDPSSAILYPAVDDEARSWVNSITNELLRIALDRVGLPARILHQEVSTLSGGERQRLALLPLVLTRPHLVVADECDGWLDDTGHDLLRHLLVDVVADGGACVVVSRAPPINATLSLGLMGDQSSSETSLPESLQGCPWPANNGTNALVCRDLTYSVIVASDTQQILRNVNLELHKGECLGIAGPNGCGKSTLAHLLSGWLVPDSGNVTVGASSIYKVPPGALPTLTGLISQFPLRQLLCGTVSDEIGLGVSTDLRDQRRRIIASVDAGILGLPTRRLTPYQARILLLTCALSFRPQVVILDEPTHGQDLAENSRLFRFLWDNLEPWQSVIVISHDEMLLNGVCHHVLRLSLNGFNL